MMLDIASPVGRSLLQVKLFNVMHAVCSEANTDIRVATKTMVSAFLLPSNKSNFMFYCDICLTKFEISRADDDSKHVDMFTSKAPSTAKVNNQSVPKLTKDNIWADTGRLESIKAPKPKAAQ